jgi:hypothetical protein
MARDAADDAALSPIDGWYHDSQPVLLDADDPEGYYLPEDDLPAAAPVAGSWTWSWSRLALVLIAGLVIAALLLQMIAPILQHLFLPAPPPALPPAWMT